MYIHYYYYYHIHTLRFLVPCATSCVTVILQIAPPIVYLA